MRSRRGSSFPLWVGFLVVAGVALAVPLAARAQGTSGPTVGSSSVGYIDNAIPGTLFRLRYDAADHNLRPSRAEFFWAKTGPGNPGPPFAEKSVDYQDLAGYLEVGLAPRFSVFAEVPYRFLNPVVNAHTNGLADMNAGFKYAFLFAEDQVATFQLRIYAPMGDADRGLGTDHVSLEPALLLYQRLTDRLGCEGELRYWVPV